MKLASECATPAAIQAVLHDEPNIYVERGHSTYGGQDPTVNNYLLGLLAEWKLLYLALIGANEASSKAFDAIARLLAGRQRTVARALNILQKSLGLPAALMIVYAGMLLTSTGVGLLGAISAGVLGVPMVKVAGFALGGAALLGLSRLKLSTGNANSMAIIAVATSSSSTAFPIRRAQGRLLQAKNGP